MIDQTINHIWSNFVKGLLLSEAKSYLMALRQKKLWKAIRIHSDGIPSNTQLLTMLTIPSRISNQYHTDPHPLQTQLFHDYLQR